jgi:hypothetical protein
MKINKKALVFLALICTTTPGLCQKGAPRIFGAPILTDTLSTLFIPTAYNEEFLSTNKIAFWNNYYANILVYNFKTDSYKKLFKQDTYIAALGSGYSYSNREPEKWEAVTKNWIFLQVKTKDTNKSGRIDEKDPAVLFAVSSDGQTRKQLTDEKENVISIDAYKDQNFILVKIQRDANGDGSFKHNHDNSFYFLKISLQDLSLGNPIEIQ